jgi:hypothetical protein
MRWAFLGVFHAGVALTAPTNQTAWLADAALGVHFDKGPLELPLVKLPYGAWRASWYDSENDVSDLDIYAKVEFKSNFLRRSTHSEISALHSRLLASFVFAKPSR